MNKKTRNQFPSGWDEKRLRRVLTHYESQTEEEALAEDEAAFENPTQTTIEVPIKLVPKIRKLIAQHQSR